MRKLINIAIIVMLCSSAWAADSTIGGLSPITTVPDAYLMPWEYNGIADFHISYSQLTNQILAGMASQGYADASALARTNGFPWGVLYDASGAGTTAAYNSTNGFPWGVLYDASGAGATAALNATNTLATGLKAYADSKTNANLAGWAGVSTNGGTAGINITGSAGTITAFQPLTNNAPALVTGLTNTGLVAGHLIIADANKAETYAVAIGAFPVDSDGTATTAGQLTNLIAQTGLPGAVIVGGIPGNAATATTASGLTVGTSITIGNYTGSGSITNHGTFLNDGAAGFGSTLATGGNITCGGNSIFVGANNLVYGSSSTVAYIGGNNSVTTYLRAGSGNEAIVLTASKVVTMMGNVYIVGSISATNGFGVLATNIAPTSVTLGVTAPDFWSSYTNTAGQRVFTPGWLNH